MSGTTGCSLAPFVILATMHDTATARERAESGEEPLTFNGPTKIRYLPTSSAESKERVFDG
jgi:hypothetical protein